MGATTRIHLKSDEATARLGRTLSQLARPGDCFLLEGQIGAGKSALARAFIRYHLGDAVDVPSPTFTLVQTYETPIGEIWHADLYRLGDTSEILELGLLDAIRNDICLIEWPELLGSLVPDTAIRISLEVTGDTRVVSITGPDRWPDLAAAMNHDP